MAGPLAHSLPGSSFAAMPFPGAPATAAPDLCVNRCHRGTGCRRCAVACPTSAITLSAAGPELDADACLACGACGVVCPTSVFECGELEQRLIQTVGSLPPEVTVLVCPLHPNPGRCFPANQIVRHRRCLAALTPADLLALADPDQRTLWLDDTACAACPLTQLHPVLVGTVAAASALYQAWGYATPVHLVSDHPAQSEAASTLRPVLDGGQPKVSRRSLFTRWAAPDSSSSALDPTLPVAHAILLERLAALPTQEVQPLSTAHGPFAAVELDAENCSGCGLCAQFCPTDALCYIGDGASFSLEFTPARCVGCGLCATACPEDAIRFGPELSPHALIDVAAQPLAAHPLTACVDCGLPTAAHSPPPRCHACRHGAGLVRPLRDDAGLMADLLAQMDRIRTDHTPSS